jgi:ribosomal protein S27E
MIEQIKDLVFYFSIECANCHNPIKVSHVVIEEKQGDLFCTLCGKTIKVPDHEKLVTAAKGLNGYILEGTNARYVKMVLNEKFVVEDAAPPAH